MKSDIKKLLEVLGGEAPELCNLHAQLALDCGTCYPSETILIGDVLLRMKGLPKEPYGNTTTAQRLTELWWYCDPSLSLQEIFACGWETTYLQEDKDCPPDEQQLKKPEAQALAVFLIKIIL